MMVTITPCLVDIDTNDISQETTHISMCFRGTDIIFQFNHVGTQIYAHNQFILLISFKFASSNSCYGIFDLKADDT